MTAPGGHLLEEAIGEHGAALQHRPTNVCLRQPRCCLLHAARKAVRFCPPSRFQPRVSRGGKQQAVAFAVADGWLSVAGLLRRPHRTIEPPERCQPADRQAAPPCAPAPRERRSQSPGSGYPQPQEQPHTEPAEASREPPSKPKKARRPVPVAPTPLPVRPHVGRDTAGRVAPPASFLRSQTRQRKGAARSAPVKFAAASSAGRPALPARAAVGRARSCRSPDAAGRAAPASWHSQL